MKKNFILLIIFLFLQNCGYSPILSNYNDQKINFNIVEIKGNDEMNKTVKLHMKKYSNNSNGEKIDLKIKTNSQKSILSKNKKGEATSYSIFSFIEFEILNTTKPKILTFQENTKTSQINNEFELNRYENTIRTNFIINKINDLVMNLASDR